MGIIGIIGKKCIKNSEDSNNILATTFLKAFREPKAEQGLYLGHDLETLTEPQRVAARALLNDGVIYETP